MSKMKQFVDGLQMELGKNYELIEVTPVNVTDSDNLNYLVKVLKKGPHIKSDLDIFYADSATKKLGRKMFLIKGIIDLYTDKVKTNQLGMVAMKKMAYLRQPKVGMPRA
jgi:hypothetical protein